MAGPTWSSDPPKFDFKLASLLLVASLAGFALGRLTSASGEKQKLPEKLPVPKSKASKEPSVDDESEDDVTANPATGSPWEEHKLVLVVRTDLGMTKGKIAAQCSHATLACYKSLSRRPATHSILQRWESRGQAKVTVQVKSEDDLLLLQAQALSLGLCAQVIHDAGRTQIASGSATVLGVGPGPKSVVDSVTGHLKLL